MRHNRNRNHRKISDSDGDLLALSNALQRIATQSGLKQQEIEKATGVDQTTISRAKNGQLKRVTRKVRRLMRYADMHMKTIKISPKVQSAATDFLAAGGTEDELLGSIRQATSIVLGHTE